MTVNVEAKTLELALVKAAGLLGVTQSGMEYEVTSESSGIFGVFGKKIALAAWKKGNSTNAAKAKRSEGKTREPAQKFARSEEPKRELSDGEVEGLVDELGGFCAEICSKMVGREVSVDRQVEDGRLVLNINDEEIGGRFAKNTKLAEAFEHILRKKPRHLRQELPFRVFVDCQNIRRAREEELVTMAHDLSIKVAKSQRPIVLNYRSSYDRKIIHMALDKHEKVSTKSIGSGTNRKLMILPTDQVELENA